MREHQSECYGVIREVRIPELKAKDPADIIVQLEESLLVELHQTDRADMFADRRNSVYCAIVNGQIPPDVSHSIVEDVSDLTSADRDQAHSHHPGLLAYLGQLSLEILSHADPQGSNYQRTKLPH